MGLWPHMCWGHNPLKQRNISENVLMIRVDVLKMPTNRKIVLPRVSTLSHKLVIESARFKKKDNHFHCLRWWRQGGQLDQLCFWIRETCSPVSYRYIHILSKNPVLKIWMNLDVVAIKTARCNAQVKHAMFMRQKVSKVQKYQTCIYHHYKCDHCKDVFYTMMPGGHICSKHTKLLPLSRMAGPKKGHQIKYIYIHNIYIIYIIYNIYIQYIIYIYNI